MVVLFEPPNLGAVLSTLKPIIYINIYIYPSSEVIEQLCLVPCHAENQNNTLRILAAACGVISMILAITYARRWRMDAFLANKGKWQVVHRPLA